MRRMNYSPPIQLQNPLPDSSFSLPPDSVAYYSDHQELRSRGSTFFRLILAIPHLIWLYLYGIVAMIALLIAWFALIFTARYPEGLYNFIADFQRYSTRVQAYVYLIIDKFPPFHGNPNEICAAHFLIGPRKERYSRPKAFFRGILILPFAIISAALAYAVQAAAFVAWFGIVFTGKQHKGVHDVMDFCFGFMVRVNAYGSLLTEDWPKLSDAEVMRGLNERGYQGPLPSADATATTAVVAPPPPAPPTPPAPPAPPTV